MTLAHWDEVGAEVREVGPIAGRWRALGSAAGSSVSGSGPGGADLDARGHSAEEELFVILEGEGTLELWSRSNTEMASLNTRRPDPGYRGFRPPPRSSDSASYPHSR